MTIRWTVPIFRARLHRLDCDLGIEWSGLSEEWLISYPTERITITLPKRGGPITLTVPAEHADVSEHEMVEIVRQFTERTGQRIDWPEELDARLTACHICGSADIAFSRWSMSCGGCNRNFPALRKHSTLADALAETHAGSIALDLFGYPGAGRPSPTT